MNSENQTGSLNSPKPQNSANFLFNEYGRLRSGWRFLIFQFLFVVFAAAFGTTILFLFEKLLVVFEKGSVLSFMFQSSVMFVPSLFLGWLCGKILEGLPFRALGLWFTKNWWKDLAFGLAIGTISITFAVILAALFGGMRLQMNESAGRSAILLTLGVSLVVFIGGALAEEAYFRGYILQTFARAKLIWFGVLMTSVFFATAHNSNQDATYLSWFNTFLAGIWFCVAYLKTRNLWFAVGLHLMWNWLQGAFFGISVSGITSLTTAPVLQQTDKGIKLWTGGDYGIEGGIACTIALVLSGVLIWFAPFLKPAEEMLELTDKENPLERPTL